MSEQSVVPSSRQGNGYADVHSVFTPTDYASLGQQMANAGMSASEIQAFLGAVESAALASARSVALAIVPNLLKLVADTHNTTAMEIHRRIGESTTVLGVLYDAHVKCKQAALSVARQGPHHA